MYQVTFEDDTEFTGGEPDSSMWDMLPEKTIKRIVYWLDENIKFDFSNFEEYNHCVERVKGVANPVDRIEKVIIMARIKQRVYQVIYDVKASTIYQICVPYGEEYSTQGVSINGSVGKWLNGKPLTGWRPGILNAAFPGPKLKRIIKESGE